MKFALGQSIPRLEDDTLLRGAGRYTDDFALARAAHACSCARRTRTRGSSGLDR